MMDATIRTKKLRLDELHPAVYNPRRISEAALKGLAASMERFGVVEPIVWNERTGNVVGGHQRLRVLHEAGAKQATVVVVDLDEREERALNVSLNNPHIAGEFTDDLQGLLEEIGDIDGLRLDELTIGELPTDFDDVAAEAAEAAGRARVFTFTVQEGGGEIVDSCFARLRRENPGAADDELFVALCRRSA